MFRVWLVALMLLALSGCGSGPESNGGNASQTRTADATATASGSISPSPSVSPPVLAELPFGMALHDCRGIRAAYRHAGDAPTGPEVPPGWEPDGPRPTIVHDTFILACSRLSLGAFERGPINVLLESHNYANIPANCLDYPPATNVGQILRGIWFDDAEVAAVLAVNWSMPVHIGVFTFSETTQQGVSVFEWSWMENGSDPSSLRYGRTETIEGGGNPLPRRYFWHDGISAYVLDMVMVDQQPLVTPPPIVGSLKPPMTPIDPYAGIFSILDPGATEAGTFHHFKDLQCSEP